MMLPYDTLTHDIWALVDNLVLSMTISFYPTTSNICTLYISVITDSFGAALPLHPEVSSA
jgi:hypothetical protein